jgi:hypothetical protein
MEDLFFIKIIAEFICQHMLTWSVASLGWISSMVQEAASQNDLMNS